MDLIAGADYPYSSQAKTEIHYKLVPKEGLSMTKGFDAMTTTLAKKAFPYQSQKTSVEIQHLLQGQLADDIAWLETNAGLEFLLRDENHGLNNSAEDKKNMPLWLKYQSLVFGFYYGLFQPLVDFKYLNDNEVYFRGLWGAGSRTFLAMCTNFNYELRKGKVGRMHVLYMLSSMYNGRPMLYNPESSRLNLVGLQGNITVVTYPIVHVSDDPDRISKFILLDLPIVHLVPNSNGELYASPSWSIDCRQAGQKEERMVAQVRRHMMMKKWSVHSTMASVFPGVTPGVVMVANCDGRLVGWSTPIAAETTLLSEANMRNAANDQTIDDTEEDSPFEGFRVLDEDWQRGSIPVPRLAVTEDEENTFGVVHSAGCEALRYAAAGFCAGLHEERVVSSFRQN